jgi:hypothetical protein
VCVNLGIEAHLADHATHAEGLSDAAPIGLKLTRNNVINVMNNKKKTPNSSGVERGIGFKTNAAHRGTNPA